MDNGGKAEKFTEICCNFFQKQQSQLPVLKFIPNFFDVRLKATHLWAIYKLAKKQQRKEDRKLKN